MTARDFLVRGLLAGLLAGLVAFAVAHQVGEPPVSRAIALEQAHPSTTDPAMTGELTFSRETQSTWGLATATLTVGLALGGLVGLAAAAAAGRLGRLRVAESTALVTLIGYLALVLVPFGKYPAMPPGIGDAATIRSRTLSYFGFVLISVLAAAIALYAGRRLTNRYTGFVTGLISAVGYLAAVLVAGSLLPAPESAGTFPADTLWSFRMASLATSATLWLVIGIVLAGSMARLDGVLTGRAARRAFAANL